MHTLYNSDFFCLTHMVAFAADAPGDEAVSREGRPVLARHGFEIVDKRSGKEVYLDGPWAELFQQRIARWQDNAPSEEEVEDTLAQFAELAQTPVLVH